MPTADANIDVVMVLGENLISGVWTEEYQEIMEDMNLDMMHEDVIE